MKSANLSSRIQSRMHSAWLLRWNQRIQDSMAELAGIQNELGWENLVPEALGEVEESKQEAYLEALLLRSSLLRAQGQEQRSSAFFAKTLTKNRALRRAQGFRLSFEYGLDCWRREDLPEALEQFLLAQKKSRSLPEKAFASTNILLCLESMDLPLDKVEAELEQIISKIENSEDIEHVLQQWHAFKARRSFYTSSQLEKKLCSKGQAAFYYRWCASLPYTSMLAPIEADADYLWQGTYRERTLAGIWSPQDKFACRVGDAIDRLYLWVWKFMAGDDISLEKIIWTLDSILAQLEIESQAKENLLLLRNACAWLSFVEPTVSSKLKKLLPKLGAISSNSFPLLEAEYALVLLLEEDSIQDLGSGFTPFPAFQKIFRGQLDFPKISKRQYELRQLKSGASTYFARIDLSSGKIKIPSSARVVASPSLASLAAKLEVQGKVSFKEFDNQCDARKIYNQVARLKELLKTKDLKIIKGNIIKGADWPSLKIVGTSAKEEAAPIEASMDIESPKLKYVGSQAHLQAAKALLKEKFGRSELENAMSVSKATACRMLSQWSAENLLIKEGSARNARYYWKEEGLRI